MLNLAAYRLTCQVMGEQRGIVRVPRKPGEPLEETTLEIERAAQVPVPLYYQHQVLRAIVSEYGAEATPQHQDDVQRIMEHIFKQCSHSS